MKISEKELKRKIGDLFYYQRIKKGLTQQEMADILSITQSSISKIEEKKSLPTLPTFFEFCRQFGFYNFKALLVNRSTRAVKKTKLRASRTAALN